MHGVACDCLQSKYQNVKPYTNKITQVTSHQCFGSAIYYDCISSKVGVSTGKIWISPTVNWKQATAEYKQQLWRGTSHMIEQRRGLGDACVLAVPAEYAGASSSSGDHPQQCYLHHPKLKTLEEKDFSPIFFVGANFFYRDSTIWDDSNRVTCLTPLGTHFNTPPEEAVLRPCVATRFWREVCVPCVVALDLPSSELLCGVAVHVKKTSEVGSRSTPKEKKLQYLVKEINQTQDKSILANQWGNQERSRLVTKTECSGEDFVERTFLIFLTLVSNKND